MLKKLSLGRCNWLPPGCDEVLFKAKEAGEVYSWNQKVNDTIQATAKQSLPMVPGTDPERLRVP